MRDSKSIHMGSCCQGSTPYCEMEITASQHLVFPPPPPPPLAFITALILLCMEFTSALIFLIGMFSHSSSNAVRNCPSVLGGSDVFLRACPVRPTNAQLGTNLDCTVASRVVQCCCLPESLGKLWLHEDGHYRAVKAFDAIALT